MLSPNHENKPKYYILHSAVTLCMEVASKVPYSSDFAVVAFCIGKNWKPEANDSYWEIKKLHQHFENNSRSNVMYHFGLLPSFRNLRSKTS